MIQILINGDDVEPIVQYLIKSELLPEAIEPHIDFIDLADYLMGIFDCTGEIMRMCILQLSQSTGDFELKATLNNYRFYKIVRSICFIDTALSGNFYKSRSF